MNTIFKTLILCLTVTFYGMAGNGPIKCVDYTTGRWELSKYDLIVDVKVSSIGVDIQEDIYGKYSLFSSIWKIDDNKSVTILQVKLYESSKEMYARKFKSCVSAVNNKVINCFKESPTSIFELVSTDEYEMYMFVLIPKQFH